MKLNKSQKYQLAWGWSASPFQIVYRLPATQMVIAIYWRAVAILCIFEVVLHAYFRSFFQKWLMVSRPLDSLGTHLIPAISQLARHAQYTRRLDRVPVMTNVITVEWFLAGVAIVVGSLAVAVDYARGRDAVIRSIGDYLVSVDRDASTVCGTNVLIWIFGAVLMSTDIGYTEMFAFYAYDLGILGIGLFFVLTVLSWLVFIATLPVAIRGQRR